MLSSIVQVERIKPSKRRLNPVFQKSKVWEGIRTEQVAGGQPPMTILLQNPNKTFHSPRFVGPAA